VTVPAFVNDAIQLNKRKGDMTDNETIHDQAQTALTGLNCAHPDTAITGLQGVLARVGPDSPDAEVIKRAIDRLEEIAHQITKVEDMLSEADFTFGKIEA
jgi:hypothetical protein